MRLRKSVLYNFLYLVYRLLIPVVDPVRFVYGVLGYFWYFRDLIKYNLTTLDKTKKAELAFLYPQLHDKTGTTSLDSHYFYQQLWLFEKILNERPAIHVDFGSSYQISGYLSKIVKTVFCDIRPIVTNLPNLEVRNEDLLNLSFGDQSLESISSLHVIEHVGLGRYGDIIDANGTARAAKELGRVLAGGGKLYLSCPIGQERVYFNAHRVLSPESVLEYFSDFKLESFSVVDDNGNYIQNAEPNDYKQAQYSCGMFVFQRF